jgi:AsmA protein
MALSRPLRWVAVILGGLFALLLTAAVVLPRIVDLQRFAPLVSGQVQALTGRTVALGPITLRILPTPAVSVASIAVHEGEKYPGRDAVRLRRLSIHLRVLPLLRGRFDFGTIVLEEPVITLIRDRQGHWSYEDILARANAAGAASQKAGGAPGAAGSAPAISVERVEIRDGRLMLYDDAVVPGRRSELTVGPIDAVLTGLGSGGSNALDLSVGLGKSRLQASAKLGEEGGARSLDATVKPSHVAAADFITLLPWLGVAHPRGLTVGGGVTVDGRVHVPLERLETVQFDGTLALDALSYKDATMTRPLEKLGGRLEVHQKSAEWKDFTATLGSSSVHGRLQVEDFLKPRIGFDLECPRIDLNEMIAAVVPPSTGGASGSAAGGGGGGGGSEDGLLQVNAKGTLRVGTLHFMTFDLQDVRGTVSLKDAVLRVSDLAAKLYGGGLKGATSVDLSQKKAAYRIDGTLDGIDVNGVAAAYDPGLKDILKGVLGGHLAVDAAGTELNGLLASAKGDARLEIVKGALTSISVLKQLAGLLEAAGGKGIGRDETPFERLSGSFAIGDKKARTNDLSLVSSDLDLAGSGDVGLDTSLDLAVAATFSEAATRGMVEKTPAARALTDKNGRLAVHLLARGNLAAPSIALDTHAQARQLTEQKKAEVKDKVRGRLLDLLTGKPKPDDPGTPPP